MKKQVRDLYAQYKLNNAAILLHRYINTGYTDGGRNWSRWNFGSAGQASKEFVADRMARYIQVYGYDYSSPSLQDGFNYAKFMKKIFILLGMQDFFNSNKIRGYYDCVSTSIVKHENSVRMVINIESLERYATVNGVSANPKEISIPNVLKGEIRELLTGKKVYLITIPVNFAWNTVTKNEQRNRKLHHKMANELSNQEPAKPKRPAPAPAPTEPFEVAEQSSVYKVHRIKFHKPVVAGGDFCVFDLTIPDVKKLLDDMKIRESLEIDIQHHQKTIDGINKQLELMGRIVEVNV